MISKVMCMFEEMVACIACVSKEYVFEIDSSVLHAGVVCV